MAGTQGAKTLRVASIGTGAIVEWFLDGVAEVPSVEYVGTYSRTMERAREFGEPKGATLFFDSLDELAACPDIDAVYIASPNGFHMEQAKIMLAAGKHVMAEKPLAANAREAQEAYAIAREKGVVLMEAMRTLHTPGFAGMAAALTELGDICSATLRFSKVSSRVPALKAGKLTNTFNPEMAGSSLLDIGIYCVAPMVSLWGAPKRIAAMGTTFDVSTIGADPRWPMIDLAGEALCEYDGFVVNLSWGKVSDNHIASQIQGTEATLLVDNLDQMDTIQVVRPVSGGVYGAYGSGEGEAEVREFPVRSSLLTEEVADFARICLNASERTRADHYERVSMDTQRVMDEIRSQMGVRFPADEA